MRALLVLGLLLLAGCTNGSSLSDNVLTTKDLGSGFTYAATDDEDFGFFFSVLNMTSNPGRANPDVFADETGYNITALYVAILQHNGTDQAVFSAALEFRTEADLEAFLREEGCGDDPDADFKQLRDGRILSLHDADEVEADIQLAFERGIDRVQDRTGATPACS